jgi:hypothetical protein
MRISAVFLLAGWAILEACNGDTGDLGEPPTDGMLVVSTFTAGEDPDRDGFQLTIDGVNSVTLEPADTAQVIIPAGRHAVGLLGVAGQCSIDPGMPLDVDIAPQGTTPVAFELNCPAVGARVTITTTGLDIDQDGYRVAVDGIDQAPIPSNAVAFIRAESGSRTIALDGLAPNCTSAGPVLQTVTIVPDQTAPVEFAVVCTATTGVIEVSLSASGTEVEGNYQVIVDGFRQPQVLTGAEPETIFVSGGDHLLSLGAPFSCSVKTGPQIVNVTVGGLVRDTVEVNFAVSCTLPPPGASGTVLITAPTTGSLPGTSPYTVRFTHLGYWDYARAFGSLSDGSWPVLGFLDPNGTLVTDLEASTESGADPYWYDFELTDVPANCTVQNPIPNPGPYYFAIPAGDTLHIEFTVTCAP